VSHEIHRVVGFEKVAPFTLEVRFEDDREQVIDFSSVLTGEIYGPLADTVFFDRVALDEEIGTLVWPNDADFDPDTLYRWAEVGPRLATLAAGWAT